MKSRPRRSALRAVVMLAAALLAPSVWRGDVAAAPVGILFSGEPFLTVLDADDNGPGAGDCELAFTFDAETSATTITPSTAAGLRVCTGAITGTISLGSDESSDFLDVALLSTAAETSSATPPSLLASLAFVQVPGTMRLSDVAVSGTPDGPPLAVGRIDFRDGASRRQAVADLCNSPTGPAAHVRFKDGSAALLPLDYFPNAQSPSHVVLRDAPTELAAPNHGTFHSVDYFFPITNDRRITAAFASDPDAVIIDIAFDQLPACPSTVEVPFLTAWGWAALLSGVVLIAIWRRIARRRTASLVA